MLVPCCYCDEGFAVVFCLYVGKQPYQNRTKYYPQNLPSGVWRWQGTGMPLSVPVLCQGEETIASAMLVPSNSQLFLDADANAMLVLEEKSRASAMLVVAGSVLGRAGL